MNACDPSHNLGPWSKTGLTLARLCMGSLFVFSGAAKLGFLEVFRPIEFLALVANSGIDPTQFAASVKAFAILHTDLIPFVVFTMPWLELLCGTALILGLMPRAGAYLINVMLLAFCAAMITVLVRKIDVECSCFGKFLGGKVGPMSLVRNAVFLAITIPVACYGGGYLALGNLFASPKPKGRPAEPT